MYQNDTSVFIDGQAGKVEVENVTLHYKKPEHRKTPTGS